jgi:flagellar protein FlaJ
MTKTIQESVEIPKIPLVRTEKFKIMLASGIASMIIVIISFSLSSAISTTTRDIGMIFGILAGVIPITLLQLKEVQRKESIDRHLPLFLLSLVSSIQSGSNLINAILLVPERNMGALNPLLRNLKANISWGMPIEEAFKIFTERAGTRIAKRVIVLLEIAYKNGGNISENLETIQKHVTELRNLETERKSALKPYTYTIYISYVVFIAIAVILSSQFFTQIDVVKTLIEKESLPGKSNVFSALSGVNIAELDKMLFNMAVIESVFGGIAAGKIGSGSYVAGIKHVVAMIVMAVIAFNII